MEDWFLLEDLSLAIKIARSLLHPLTTPIKGTYIISLPCGALDWRVSGWERKERIKSLRVIEHNFKLN